MAYYIHDFFIFVSLKVLVVNGEVISGRYILTYLLTRWNSRSWD